MGSNLTQGSSFVFEKRVALSVVDLQCSKISTFALRMHAEIDNEEGGASHVWNVYACLRFLYSEQAAGSGQDAAHR